MQLEYNFEIQKNLPKFRGQSRSQTLTKIPQKYTKLPHVVHASIFGITQYYYKRTQKCKNLPKIQGLSPSQTPCKEVGLKLITRELIGRSNKQYSQENLFSVYNEILV